MLRLRQYKRCDSEKIAKWLEDENVYFKWGGKMMGDYPLPAAAIDETYRAKNGFCEEDNFYPWVALDDNDNVVGHFIMRYLNGNRRLLRFGWVIVDDSIRGRGYGTEMLRLGLKYAFGIFGAEKITIGVFEKNDIAANCYRKLGFKEVETVPGDPWNVIEMELLREDWKDVY